MIEGAYSSFRREQLNIHDPWKRTESKIERCHEDHKTKIIGLWICKMKIIYVYTHYSLFKRKFICNLPDEWKPTNIVHCFLYLRILIMILNFSYDIWSKQYFDLNNVPVPELHKSLAVQRIIAQCVRVSCLLPQDPLLL